MNLIKRFFGFFFGFNGRIGRLHFAIFLPFFLVIYVFIVGFLSIFTPRLYQYTPSDRLIGVGIILVIAAVFYVLKYSHITRRVHDLNKRAMDSGLFFTILAIDIISTIITTKFDILSFLSLPLALISILCIIILAFKKGDQEENNFGKPQIPFWKK